MADAGKQPISNPDSKETTYVKHALNLALREEDINEHEKNHMLIAWIDAEVGERLILQLISITTLTSKRTLF